MHLCSHWHLVLTFLNFSICQRIHWRTGLSFLFGSKCILPWKMDHLSNLAFQDCFAIPLLFRSLSSCLDLTLVDTHLKPLCAGIQGRRDLLFERIAGGNIDPRRRNSFSSAKPSCKTKLGPRMPISLTKVQRCWQRNLKRAMSFRRPR